MVVDTDAVVAVTEAVVAKADLTADPMFVDLPGFLKKSLFSAILMMLLLLPNGLPGV
ncbi:hypothetical protein Hanom_Chr04g00310841 [Helianthus anomalus]